MKTHKASDSERIILKQQMALFLEKEAEKPEVVLHTHAILWELKEVNLLWMFTDMQPEKLHLLKSVAQLLWEGY